MTATKLTILQAMNETVKINTDTSESFKVPLREIDKDLDFYDEELNRKLVLREKLYFDVINMINLIDSQIK